MKQASRAAICGYCGCKMDVTALENGMAICPGCKIQISTLETLKRLEIILERLEKVLEKPGGDVFV